MTTPVHTASALQSSGAAHPRRPTRGLRLFRSEVIVPRGLDETFAFFSDARNLDRLTPPWVGFEIVTPGPIDMRVGAEIEYRIRIHGVPISWRTQITVWEPKVRFIDVQLRGPYRWWHHEHRFEACDEGTRVIDEVEYCAPLAWLTHRLFVDRDVARIFAYRADSLAKILGDISPQRELRERAAPLAAVI